jgi:hypothetical protein
LSKVRTDRAENGVRSARVWAGLLGVEKTVVERVEFTKAMELVARREVGEQLIGRLARNLQLSASHHSSDEFIRENV